MAAVAATPAFAHHSAGAFDRTKEMTVTGTVKTWRWANPHPEMRIVVAGSGATAGEYIFEYPAPTTMIDRGYSRNFVKVGDQVKIKYNPWRSGTNGGLYQDVTTPDGKSMKVRQ
ncbi:MAG: hypothetical protein B7Y99_13370 [Caulobacterales bacterium 32-69-10]|nr:MAG: hypothetical protein B7Y99_13370 [Caulobacterales bacterium 32-69-10]